MSGTSEMNVFTENSNVSHIEIEYIFATGILRWCPATLISHHPTKDPWGTGKAKSEEEYPTL